MLSEEERREEGEGGKREAGTSVSLFIGSTVSRSDVEGGEGRGRRREIKGSLWLLYPGNSNCHHSCRRVERRKKGGGKGGGNE